MAFLLCGENARDAIELRKVELIDIYKFSLHLEEINKIKTAEMEKHAKG